ncbi:MAG: helix-hairpin-helix domain-containing protein [Synergistaceae bacterium]|nr:helix-hairpin-helix domain-containing protein [Synergistaceae bacterium]
MSEVSGKNKSLLITAAGVVIFLALGLYTMIFFPEREKKIQAPKQNLISENQEIKPEFKIEESELKVKSETKPEETKIEKPKPDWFVYVTGEVKNPGIYKVSADSRIFEAVYAAGGFTEKADDTSVNLASKLTDGLQINVLAKGAKKKIENSNFPARTQGQAPLNDTVVINQRNSSQTQFRSSKTQNNDGKVNINSANAQELEKLNGVGPAIAKRIVEYRNSHGNFSSSEDLLKVKGIGKAKLEKMRSQIKLQN